MSPRFRQALCAATLMLALTSCQAGPSSPSAADKPPVVGVSRVVATHLAFSPPVVQVPAGTTVTWSFEDNGVPHDVRGPGFLSPVVHRGTWSHTFAEPGTYRYDCTIHAGMVGKVIVTPR